METIRFSKTGTVTIPARLQDYFQWKDGQELMVINTGDGILLKPKKVFPETTLNDVAGCLHYKGKAKTLEEMEEAINTGLQEQWKT